MMTKTEWQGFERIDFLFEDREATLVFPKQANPNRNWLLKTEYFGAFPGFEIEMLKRGWHLAYIKNVTRWCLDEDLDLKQRFADEKYYRGNGGIIQTYGKANCGHHPHGLDDNTPLIEFVEKYSL